MNVMAQKLFFRFKIFELKTLKSLKQLVKISVHKISSKHCVSGERVFQIAHITMCLIIYSQGK